MLGEISYKEKQILNDFTCMWNLNKTKQTKKKTSLLIQRTNWWSLEGRVEVGKRNQEVQTFSYKKTSHGDIMYSMMTIH